MLTGTQKRLLDYLKQKGVLRENQVDEVEMIMKSSEKKDIREVLIKGGFFETEKLAQHEADFFNYPYINLLSVPVTDEVKNALPKNIAEQHQAMVFGQEGKRVKVAIANPEDYDVREAIDFWASSKGLITEYHLCSYAAWKQKMDKTDMFGEEVASAVGQVEKEREEKSLDDVSTENIEEIIKQAPVAQIVSMIVKHAMDNRASDIHIEPYEKSSRVRFRVDDLLNTVLTLPAHIHESVIARVKVLAHLKLDETRVPQDGRFKFQIKDHEFDLRVSIMPLAGQEKVTLRILDMSGKSLTLEQLGFSKKIRDIVDETLKLPFGMTLITGPTGAGKSTSLFSILSMMNKEGVNISTLEDPVEYNIPGINQAQIRPDVEFTFASGLRALLRQDPDIIMVGEIRDGETAEMGVHAALTGHILFSTLHTNDSIGAIPRLVDMQVEPFLLASTLNLVIAQRLSRRICSKCRESYPLPEDIKAQIRKELSDVPADALPEGIDLDSDLVAYRGVGCSVCKDTGYTGRVVLSEALPVNNKMKNLIANGFPQDEVKAELKKMGIVSLLQDGVIKALQGVTSLEEVFRVSKEVEEQE